MENSAQWVQMPAQSFLAKQKASPLGQMLLKKSFHLVSLQPGLHTQLNALS